MSSNFDQRQWIFNRKHTEKKLKEKVDNEDFNNHNERHEVGGADEINLDGLQGESAELANHKTENMPHLIYDKDNNKTYRYGYQYKDGGMQLIYEEVV